MDRAWRLRPALSADAEWLADLKALAMRPDLERLGLWDEDEDWARRRFLDTYVPANTDIIEVDEKPVGAIAVRPEVDAQWIEHFYLDPVIQGQGIGSQVLRCVMDAHRDARPFRLAIDRVARRAGSTSELASFTSTTTATAWIRFSALREPLLRERDGQIHPLSRRRFAFLPTSRRHSIGPLRTRRHWMTPVC
ncbi:hypothetical protein Vqi01_60040 [Micromonospora qiuiae]|uniref:N-acetyltransferase domain-containing protein n=1 Tax=Micromonospora qiuiae TaxID=502268 RepID=A0ABQ4JJQ3_9ACTN|nr:GNAT family N-acetyltransferase [Micromonospora qiuiae]GIJ30842.1 hypothetical protein Vqi01_60040 [Micromonospora qiuiae]